MTKSSSLISESKALFTLHDRESGQMAVLFTPHCLQTPDHKSHACVVRTGQRQDGVHQLHRLPACLGRLVYKTMLCHEKIREN